MIRQMLFCVLATSIVTSGCTAKEDLGTDGEGGAGGSVPLTVLATNQNTPWSIAIDDANVYWVNASPLGGIYKVPKAGGAVVELTKGQYGEVDSFGVDTTNVYMPLNDTIIAQPIAGGPSTVVATNTTDLQGVAVADGNIYWAEVDVAGYPQTPPVAKMVPTSGGTPTLITVPAGTSALGGFSYDTVASDGVYASSFGGSDILRLPFAGGTATVIQAATNGVIAVDDSNIYVSIQGAVASVPKSGGTPTPIAAVQNATSIVVDGDYLYVADDTSTGRILKMPKSGSPVTVLADNQGAPHSIAVDATSVYWNCINEGTIKKIGK